MAEMVDPRPKGLPRRVGQRQLVVSDNIGEYTPNPPAPEREVSANPDSNKPLVETYKFKEVFSPTESLLQNEQSWPRPPANTQEFHQRLQALSEEETKHHIERQIARGSSFLGTPDRFGLFELSRFRRQIIGFFAPSYRQSGSRFCSGIYGLNGFGLEMTEEYEGLWLDVQFFWDLMLRMQPNPITNDLEQIKTAVDLMADISAARLALEVRSDCTAETAHRQIREFRRRLRRLNLQLRTTLSTCGRGPKMLCGCVVTLKLFKHNSKLWMSLSGSNGATGPEKRHFKVRDVACLLRLEDFLSFVSRIFEASVGREPDDGAVVKTAQTFMDESVKNFLPDILSTNDLKLAWIDTLCNPEFRSAICSEVKCIVDEAVNFERKHNFSQHRQECDHWEPPKSSLTRFSFGQDRSKKSENGQTRSESKGMALLDSLRTMTFTK
ncbi:Fc.00g044280.m01.CDS01 [Cosmosporella sp. VM-42]